MRMRMKRHDGRLKATDFEGGGGREATDNSEKQKAESRRTEY